MGSKSEHRAGGLDSAPIVHRLDKRDCISGVIVDRNCAAQTTRRIESENYGNIATGSHHELRSTSGILLKVSTRGDSRDLECAGSGIGEREGQGLACSV